ncbi:syntaxin-22-like [Musa acuminata AAA Group]|uniref:syntaxin-22-like n=1 Tax=Musa acuminata AAA Group TaxID=214697 RepID=UPI0031E3BAD7
MKREDARNASPSRPWPLTSSPGEETAAGEDAGDDDDRLLLWEQTRQELLSLENEIVFNEAIIEEREKDIKETHYDVQQIHEIYQDLAVLLHDQPIGIDNIDKRIEESAASTGRAKEQLYKASKCTRTRSSWVCWVLIILVLVLVLVLVILLLVLILHRLLARHDNPVQSLVKQ